jgi:chromosome segregation ATPase
MEWHQDEKDLMWSRFNLIRDRLAYYKNEIPAADPRVDFLTHAVDDMEWLLEQAREMYEKEASEEEDVLDTTKDQFESMANEICGAERTLERVVDLFPSIRQELEVTRKHFDNLRTKIPQQAELLSSERELEKANQKLVKIREENAELKAKLDALPPTWLERLEEVL